MPDIKLIFFDMEGTLFKQAAQNAETNVAPSAWFAIAKALGDDALKEELETQDKWNTGKYISYIDWMEDTIQMHKKYKLTKKIFYSLLDSIPYVNNVKETFKILQTQNIKTALVSGGFKYQADKAIKDLKINHAFIGCDYFWNDKDCLDHWALLPADFNGKVHFMKLLINEYKYSKNDCAFVGDGKNDIELAKAVGTSIAFNAHENLKKVTTYSIDDENNFKDIIKLLNL